MGRFCTLFLRPRSYSYSSMFEYEENLRKLLRKYTETENGLSVFGRKIFNRKYWPCITKYRLGFPKSHSIMITNILVSCPESLSRGRIVEFSKGPVLAFITEIWPCYVLFNLNHKVSSLPSGITYWKTEKNHWMECSFMAVILSFKIHRGKLGGRTSLLLSLLSFLLLLWSLCEIKTLKLVCILSARDADGSRAKSCGFQIRYSAHSLQGHRFLKGPGFQEIANDEPSEN